MNYYNVIYFLTGTACYLKGYSLAQCILCMLSMLSLMNEFELTGYSSKTTYTGECFIILSILLIYYAYENIMAFTMMSSVYIIALLIKVVFDEFRIRKAKVYYLIHNYIDINN